MVVVKKVIHSNDFPPPSLRRSSRGKMSDSDKLGVLGGPLAVFHVRRLGSCILCWIAASDNGEEPINFSRAGPHRRTAEVADSICTLVSKMDHRRNRYRRWKVSSPMITGSKIERSLSGGLRGEYENERVVNVGERRNRWRKTVAPTANQRRVRSPGHKTPSVEPRDIKSMTFSGIQVLQ